MPESEVRSVLRRADTISYGTLAEMNHFQTERVKDIRLMMQLFLRSQVNFYQEVCMSASPLITCWWYPTLLCR